MPPVVIAAGVAAAGSIAASQMAADAAADGRDAQARLLGEAGDLIKQVNVPGIQSQLIKIQQLKAAGNLTPEQEQALLQQETELKKIMVSPEFKEAQMRALTRLQQIADEGGLNPAERAKMNEIVGKVNNSFKANNEAIAQSMAQRGVGGSSAELAAKLSGGQQATDLAANMGTGLAGEAYKNALNSIVSGGELAGKIREQDYGEQKDVATAQDAINRFNTQTRQDVQNRNVNRNAEAQKFNIGNEIERNKFNIANNADEQKFNSRLYQQQFQNYLDKAKAQANPMQQQGQVAAERGQAEAQGLAGIGQGIAQGATAIGQYYADQSRPKTDMTGTSSDYMGSTAGNRARFDDLRVSGYNDYSSSGTLKL